MLLCSTLLHSVTTLNTFKLTQLCTRTTIKEDYNKYGSVQELRSTFREFDFVLVMFRFGSE